MTTTNRRSTIQQSTMDQEVIVIDDDVSEPPKVTKPRTTTTTKSIKRRSTADIPTKKQPTKKSRKDSNTQTQKIAAQPNVSSTTSTPLLSTTELNNKINLSASVPASPSNDVLHNGILNIAQELAMNRNNGTNSTSPELPIPPVQPVLPNNQSTNVKQVKISSLLSTTTVTPPHHRLLNPGNGAMEHQQQSITNTIINPKVSDLFLKSMQILNNNNNNTQESNQYIASTVTPLNSTTTTTPVAVKSKTTTPTAKKSAATTKQKKVSPTPKPTKAKKTKSLSEKTPASKSTTTSKPSTAPSTPKTPATKTNAPKKKKTSNTTTTNSATAAKGKSATVAAKIKSLPTLKPKPSTSNTPDVCDTSKSNAQSSTPVGTPKIGTSNQTKAKKASSTAGSTTTKTKSTVKSKSGTTPKIGALASNPSSNSNTTNATSTTTTDKKKIVPKTLISSPAINPPSLVKSSSVLTAKNDLIENKAQNKPIKEEKAIILDIPLYNTTSNDYLDENGTVVVNVFKLITTKEEEEKKKLNGDKNGLSLEEEKLKKRNMFMNKDDVTKLGSDEEDIEAIDEDDDEKTEANAEPKKKAHPMKGKSQIGKYDIEDPFIDDTELLWDEQRAATKDGFFVFFGPLVEKGEVPKIERAASSLRRAKR